MAKATEITVGVNVSIPDETVRRCCSLLEMWMDDNPDRNLVCDRIPCKDRVRHRIRIQTWRSDDGGSN